MFTKLKAARLLCGLTQADISVHTGVSIAAISAAERGQKQLSQSEQSLVTDFLKQRWAALQELDRRVPDSVRQGAERIS